jgi:hypothetical protein
VDERAFFGDINGRIILKYMLKKMGCADVD